MDCSLLHRRDVLQYVYSLVKKGMLEANQFRCWCSVMYLMCCCRVVANWTLQQETHIHRCTDACGVIDVCEDVREQCKCQQCLRRHINSRDYVVLQSSRNVDRLWQTWNNDSPEVVRISVYRRLQG
jgi:hypothetical protein